MPPFAYTCPACPTWRSAPTRVRRAWRIRHAWIFLDVEQGEPGVCVVQITYDIARSFQDTPRGTSLEPEGAASSVGDH